MPAAKRTCDRQRQNARIGPTVETRAAAVPNNRQKDRKRWKAVRRTDGRKRRQRTDDQIPRGGQPEQPAKGWSRRETTQRTDSRNSAAASPNSRQRTGAVGKQRGRPTAETRAAAGPNSRRKGRNYRKAARQTDSRSPRDGQPEQPAKGPEPLGNSATGLQPEPPAAGKSRVAP